MPLYDGPNGLFEDASGNLTECSDCCEHVERWLRGIACSGQVGPCPDIYLRESTFLALGVNRIHTGLYPCCMYFDKFASPYVTQIPPGGVEVAAPGSPTTQPLSGCNSIYCTVCPGKLVTKKICTWSGLTLTNEAWAVERNCLGIYSPDELNETFEFTMSAGGGWGPQYYSKTVQILTRDPFLFPGGQIVFRFFSTGIVATAAPDGTPGVGQAWLPDYSLLGGTPTTQSNFIHCNSASLPGYGNRALTGFCLWRGLGQNGTYTQTVL